MREKFALVEIGSGSYVSYGEILRFSKQCAETERRSKRLATVRVVFSAS